MTPPFADACYWIALANRNDQLHPAALAAQSRIGLRLVTSDEVLTEVLNFLSGHGSHLRSVAVSMIEGIRADTNVDVVFQSRQSFDEALNLYRNRLDKGYSLTDCSSFTIMHRLGMREALTDDIHFVQEGFIALLKAP